MNTSELVMITAAAISFLLSFSAISVVNQYNKETGLETSERYRLYFISVLIPLLGFLLTRRLKKGRA